MADERKAILLRIPKPLWESLNRWAADDLRSLNGQIEFVLREAVRTKRGGLTQESGSGSPEGTPQRRTEASDDQGMAGGAAGSGSA